MKWLTRISLYYVLLLVSLISLRKEAVDLALDPGLGWHLKTGAWILQHLAIPRIDPFLAGLQPRPWIADQWLGDVLLYLLYSLAGWPFLYTCLFSLYFLSFVPGIYGRLRAASFSCLAGLLATLICFKLGQIHFLIRPVIFSFPLFAALYFLLQYKYQQLRISGQMSWLKLSCAVFLLMLCWVNIHPSFVLGDLLLGVFAFSCLMRKKFYSSKNISGLCLLGSLSIFANLFNPNTSDLLMSVLALRQSSYGLNFYQEWQAPGFSTAEGLYFWAAFCYFLISLIIQRRVFERLGLFPILATLLFGCWATNALRMLPYFGIAATLPLACVSDLWLSSLRPSAVKAALARIEGREILSPPGNRLLILLLICFCFLGMAGWNVLGLKEYGPPTRVYPYQAVAFLEQRALAEGSPLPVLHPMSWGGFITFYGNDRVLAHLDDRTVMLGDDFYKEYFEVWQTKTDYTAYLDKYQLRYILLNNEAALVETLDRDTRFQKIYQDEISRIYTQRHQN